MSLEQEAYPGTWQSEEMRRIGHLNQMYQMQQQMQQQQQMLAGDTKYYAQGPPQFAYCGQGGSEAMTPPQGAPLSAQGQQQHLPPNLAGPPQSMYMSNFHPMPLLPFDQVQAMMQYYMGMAQLGPLHQQKQQSQAAATAAERVQVPQYQPEQFESIGSLQNSEPQETEQTQTRCVPQTKKEPSRAKNTKQANQKQKKTKQKEEKEVVESENPPQKTGEEQKIDTLPANSPWNNTAKIETLRSAEGAITVQSSEPTPRGRVNGSKASAGPVRGRGRGNVHGTVRGRGGRNMTVVGKSSAAKPIQKEQFDAKERARYGTALRQARQTAFEELIAKNIDTVHEKLSEAHYTINSRSGLPNQGWSVNFRTLRKIVDEENDPKRNSKKKDIKKKDAAPRPHKTYADTVSVEICETLEENQENNEKKIVQEEIVEPAASSSEEPKEPVEGKQEKTAKQEISSPTEKKDAIVTTEEKEKTQKKKKHVYSFSRERFYKNREFQESVRQAYFGMLRTADLIHPVRVYPGRQQQDVPRLQIGFAYEATKKTPL